MKNFIYLFIGILFGLGLTISQMINPDKVFAFLDIAGAWDPSLLFTMGGALSVFIPCYFIFIKKREKPILSDNFNIPTKTKIDKELVLGSTLFGVGWGLAGICPGPAIVNISSVLPYIFIFIIVMLLGMYVARLLKSE